MNLRGQIRRFSNLSFGALFLLLLLILIAWSSNTFWDALSPVTYKKQLYQLAGETQVDPLILASIIKAESGFNPYASSEKGALGLMQLLPETAEAMAAELKIDYQDPEDLYRDEINLKLGAHYFAKLLKAFDGQLVLALAAYNCGPSKVRSWKLAIPSAQEELIAEIPLPETRSYVRRVLKNYRLFKALRAVKRSLRGDDAL
jgi:soluble lytic murein transglycosylase